MVGLKKKCKMYIEKRQGCPVSAIFFTFVMEILNWKISSSNSIRGFRLETMEKEVKCLQLPMIAPFL